jgi:hypothetical protein
VQGVRPTHLRTVLRLADLHGLLTELSNAEINKALKGLSIAERMEAKAALQRIGLMSPGRLLQDAGC